MVVIVKVTQVVVVANKVRAPVVVPCAPLLYAPRH
jgi:hypothetical protein